MPAVALPFESLPAVWQILFTAAFVVIAVTLVWTTLLFVRARHARRDPPEAPEQGADAFTWVFLVPALNEALTIRDSVGRLLDVPVADRHIVVVDDGSGDGTGELLAGMSADGLHKLRRDPPQARQGKAAALNFAYRRLGDVDRSRVIVVIDADGRLHTDAPLDAVADHEGPWRDRLTEDQDLGIRLIGAGWEGRQELRAVIEQQAVPGLRRLLRQRTRWSQGNLQAMGLLGELWHAQLPLIARLDQVAYLLQPVFQSLIGLSLVAALGLAVFDVTPLWGDAEWWEISFVYLLGFGGVLMGCIACGAARGVWGVLKGILVAQVYAFYTWLLWPVLIRATARQLTDRRSWARTEREQVTAA